VLRTLLMLVPAAVAFLLPAFSAQKSPAPAKSQTPSAPRQIAIVNPRVSQYEDGPALPPGYAFVPGESVFVSFQIAGYQKSEQAKILVEYRLKVTDPEGVPVIEPKQNKVAAELSPEDKDWLPKVREQVIVPPTADSGTFHVAAWVKDMNGAEAIKDIEFPVRGHHVEAVKVLTLQSFRFLRSENDTASLPETPSYRPGDMVWAKFDITGYKFGAKNRYAVKYGLAVHDADDKELYAVPEAASDSDETYYPKKFVPGMLSFGLPPDIRPGLYTVVLRVEDTGGTQKAEGRFKFRVE
jgi:hypothetical protein